MATASDKSRRVGEPITPEELLERARALRPLVEERAEETERLTHIPEDLHRRFDEAGFYRMLMPKRYGGLETDLPTYVKVWMEIARGDPSAAWCGCLAANHALQLGSWWPERAQDEIFGTQGGLQGRLGGRAADGLRAARRRRLGAQRQGSYCSGIPYSTHYIGQALTEPAAKGRSARPAAPVRCAAQRFQDPRRLGRAHRHDRQRLEQHRVRQGRRARALGAREHAHGRRRGGGRHDRLAPARQPDVRDARPRLLHDDRRRRDGRAPRSARSTSSNSILKARKTIRAPFVPWAEDPDHQRWFGDGDHEAQDRRDRDRRVGRAADGVRPRHRRGRQTIHVRRRSARRRDRARGILRRVAAMQGGSSATQARARASAARRSSACCATWRSAGATSTPRTTTGPTSRSRRRDSACRTRRCSEPQRAAAARGARAQRPAAARAAGPPRLRM